MPPWTKVNERCVLFHQSVILFFLYIIQNRIIWQAVVPFLLLTLLLLGYNQEIMWTTEHLPLQRPNKSQLTTSYGQRSLRGRVGMHLHRYWHLTTCGYPSKTLDAKNLSRFSANVPSLKKFIRHENFTNCPEIWSKYSQDINYKKSVWRNSVFRNQ